MTIVRHDISRRGILLLMSVIALTQLTVWYVLYRMGHDSIFVDRGPIGLVADAIEGVVLLGPMVAVLLALPWMLKRRMLAGSIWGATLALVPWLGASASRASAAMGWLELAIVMVSAVLAAVLAGGLSAGLGAIYTGLGLKLVPQDGRLCGRCAYPVTPSGSSRCPECAAGPRWISTTRGPINAVLRVADRLRHAAWIIPAALITGFLWLFLNTAAERSALRHVIGDAPLWTYRGGVSAVVFDPPRLPIESRGIWFLDPQTDRTIMVMRGRDQLDGCVQLSFGTVGTVPIGQLPDMGTIQIIHNFCGPDAERIMREGLPPAYIDAVWKIACDNGFATRPPGGPVTATLILEEVDGKPVVKQRF